MSPTAIEWTEETWNPVTGCSKVSPGCANCYAERIELRFGRSLKPWTPKNAAENVKLHPDRLEQPLRWRKPRIIFTCSMSDLFHEAVPDPFIAKVFDRMAQTPWHTYQVLTKRPERMRYLLREAEAKASDGWLGAFPFPLPNVWLGTLIENRRFVHRADVLRETPAAVRFVSAEPLLGALIYDSTHMEPDTGGTIPCWHDTPREALDARPMGYVAPEFDLTDIDWLIVGGESGPHLGRKPYRFLVDADGSPRPGRAEWVRDLRDAAAAAGTAFFFKQWGGRTPRAGGRELDGRTWDEVPSVTT